MAQRKEVSIQSIADLCGVSIATVSRVLNNDRRVAQKTRRRILDAMEEHHYVAPPVQPPAVRKIGIIIHTEISDYYMALVLRLHDELKKAGFQMIMGSLGYDSGELPVILDTLYDSNVSGVILITCDCLSIRDRLDGRIPHVWIDCNDPPEVTGDICQVQSDQYVSGVLAAQELYRKGCVRPIILGGSRTSHRMLERIQGFRDEYGKHNIDIGEERIVRTPLIREILVESKQMVRYLLSKGFPFDSVFAISDWRALGAYLALTEAGLKVPEDVKVIGYDGVSIASRVVLNITSVQQNVSLIARYAVDLLLRLTRREEISEKRIIVPTDILTGQTL